MSAENLSAAADVPRVRVVGSRMRIVQILWNLTGAYFVVRGHYHKPTAAEKSGKPGDAARAKEKRLDKRDRPPTWSP